MRPLIGPLACVNDEWPVRRRAAVTRDQIRTEFERMRPAEPAHDADREAAFEDRMLVRIVMRHRGHAVEKILDRSPEQAHPLRHGQMLPQGGAIDVIDVGRPRGSVRIRTAAKPREKIELEMVVRVDQARKHNMAAQDRIRPQPRTAVSNGRIRPPEIVMSIRSACVAESATRAPVIFSGGTMT